MQQSQMRTLMNGDLSLFAIGLQRNSGLNKFAQGDSQDRNPCIYFSLISSEMVYLWLRQTFFAAEGIKHILDQVTTRAALHAGEQPGGKRHSSYLNCLDGSWVAPPKFHLRWALAKFLGFRGVTTLETV